MSGIPDEITLHIVPLNITGGLGIGLNGTLVVDAGLDDVNVKATGDPNLPIAVDMGLDNIHLTLDPLKVTLDPLKITVDPLKITVDPLKVDLGLDNINLCLSLAFTQLPRMQLHFPTKWDFGFSLFGMPVVGFGVCGEASLVCDDNPPRIFRKAATAPHPTPPPPPPTTPPTNRTTGAAQITGGGAQVTGGAYRVNVD